MSTASALAERLGRASLHGLLVRRETPQNPELTSIQTAFSALPSAIPLPRQHA